MSSNDQPSAMVPCAACARSSPCEPFASVPRKPSTVVMTMAVSHHAVPVAARVGAGRRCTGLLRRRGGRLELEHRHATACVSSGGPKVVMPYFASSESSCSMLGRPPGGVIADSSSKKCAKSPGVVTMSRRAVCSVKF